MMMIGLQFFAHKKGGGSTKNGRDHEKPLSVPCHEGVQKAVFDHMAESEN